MNQAIEDQKEKVSELKSEVGSGDAVKINPINRVSKNGNMYEYSYDHGGVVVEDIVDSFKKYGRDYIAGDDIIVTVYEGEEPLALTEEGVFCRQDARKDSVEQQAYYALSLLAEDGLVKKWRKR
jgi:hypothetical protein